MNAVSTLNEIGSGSLANTEAIADGPVGTVIYVFVGATILLAFVGIIYKFVGRKG